MSPTRYLRDTVPSKLALDPNMRYNLFGSLCKTTLSIHLSVSLATSALFTLAVLNQNKPADPIATKDTESKLNL